VTRTHHHLPTFGIAAALALIAVAASRYPGGTTDSATTVGYSWAHNFISALFGDRALNGAPNPVRLVATVAMFVLCVSIAIVFQRLSTRFPSQRRRKTIQIAGIGTAVYSFLIVTRMHDLMVDIGLLFTFVAILATTQGLYIARRRFLFVWGAGCFSLTAAAATMYYGHLFYEFLPVVQKVTLISSIAWLLCAYYALVQPREEVSHASRASPA
jgi:hypothetical protein